MPDTTDTAHLGLPYLAAAQAQKHVTHNEALRILDTVVQLAVIDASLTAAPGSPAQGDRYIVGASATGDWAGHGKEVAAFVDGAWEFHERLIPNSDRKPIRIWMMVGDRDLLNPNVMRDGMHDWVLANERMAGVLASKGYSYQFVFAQDAGHVDGRTKRQTLPQALEWLWKDYRTENP